VSRLPGPRLPRPVAGVRFLASEHRMLARYRRRYGDVFAVDVWPFDPLVVVGDPAEVKRIFRGDPEQLHAGEGNRVLGPIVGPSSCWCSTRRSTWPRASGCCRRSTASGCGSTAT
jgi:hypothetical protein